VTTARLHDAGHGWRCSKDGTCCTSPTGERYHAHRIVGELLVCSTGVHETVRMDGRPMTVTQAPATKRSDSSTASPGVYRRSLTPAAQDADLSSVLAKLRAMTTSPTAASKITTTPADRLRVVAPHARRGDRDHQGDAIASEIDLAAEIAPHAGRDDVATLRRLGDHYAKVAARLVGTA